jgi:hypothetical protein
MRTRLTNNKALSKARPASGKILHTTRAKLAGSELSPQCGDNSRNEIVAATRRQSESGFLSLAPGFSQVSGAVGMGKPFQRFLCAGGKPLKRFACHAAVNTRLKPGANEMKERDGIHVASYVTKLIPKKQLEQKLHQAVRLARARLEEGGKL